VTDSFDYEADTESVPTPTLPSVAIPVAIAGGKKFDTGKIRTDLLPMGAIDEAARAVALIDETRSAPWSAIQAHLTARKRGAEFFCGVRSMAIVAGALLVLLTRDIAGDVRASQLLPACGPGLLEVAKVLTFGAAKYGENNWQGLDAFSQRYLAALLRHVFAYGSGEKADPESGLPHLAHAACCALFLLSREVGHDPSECYEKVACGAKTA
jgi:hypothetical protein